MTVEYFKGSVLSRLVYGLNPFFEGPIVGQYLQDRTEKDDTIFILGSEPQFLFYANRRHACEFVFAYNYTGNHPRVLDLQKSVIEQIKTNHPKYILKMNIPQSYFVNEKAGRYLADNLDAILEREYAYEASLVALSNTNTAMVQAAAPPTDKRFRLNLMDIYRRK